MDITLKHIKSDEGQSSIKEKINLIDYYAIAKKAYCTEGDQWDCRDCGLIDYFEKNNRDSAKCRKHLIIGLVKQYEKLLEKRK